MIIPMLYTHFGYEYLDKVKSVVPQLHSGVDLNYGSPEQDNGMDVKSVEKGEVVFAKNTGKGWGNLVVVYHSAYGIWSRYGHLRDIKVSEGDIIKEGRVIGLCGSTGGNWPSHLHWDVLKKQLDVWTRYTSWWSVEKVREYYHDPIPYVNMINESEHAPEEPIVLWHKENKVIEKWSNPATPAEKKLGWAVYKGLKQYDKGGMKFNL